MTMEVGSFVGELVRGKEKVDVEDVLDRLGDGCALNLMSLPWLYAVTRDVSNFKTLPDWRGARVYGLDITSTDSVDQLWILFSAWMFCGR